MAKRGLEQRVTSKLRATNRAGGYPASLVCTDGGLLIASAGEDFEDESFAAFTSLFDDIVMRASRDLAMGLVDEVTLLDQTAGRLIIRPIPIRGDTNIFLVIRAPRRATWRRHTNKLCSDLAVLLAPLVQQSLDIGRAS